MFNLCNSTEVKNFEGFNMAHIQHQLYADKAREIKYSRVDRRASRGIATIHTKYGELRIRFEERDGWARMIERV